MPCAPLAKEVSNLFTVNFNHARDNLESHIVVLLLHAVQTLATAWYKRHVHVI